MNLSIITTLGANAGDNFVYEGFKNLFPAKHYGSTFLIDKTAIPEYDNYKKLIDESDLIVICGTPIFYSGCYKMKWQKKILEYSKKSKKKILLFAVGSNFRYSSDGTIEIPDIINDNNYKSFASRYDKLTQGGFIVREKYCLQFLKDMGFTNVQQIVCPSLFAYNAEFSQDERDLVFIIWGDTYWNCAFPPEEILRKCQQVKDFLKSRLNNKRVIWVCHDFVSYTELSKHVPKKDILTSNNYMDFFKYYHRCFFALSVKLHGSMLLASMGVPSLLIQLDSRAAVMELLNEECAKPSSSVEELNNLCEKKLEIEKNYRDQIGFLKSKYREEYKELFIRLGFI
jgi:hypothetical protein